MTDIVRTAVLGCYGVAGFSTPAPWGYLVRWLGLGEPGIRIDLTDLRIELRIRVAYGLPIAEVARQVESAVRYALQRDLGRESSEVAIHIDGLVARAGTVPEPADIVESVEDEAGAARTAAAGTTEAETTTTAPAADVADPGAEPDTDLDPPRAPAPAGGGGR